MSEPFLTRLDAPETRAPRAIVLMLHGGKPSSNIPVDGRSASWRRIAAMQQAITPALHQAGVGTWLLRFSTRGWNGGADRVADARRALEQVRIEHGEIPVVLLGHSMGARTAVHVADDAQVTGVVALAPWFNDSDPVRTLTGRTLRAAHGRRDRITSYRATAAYVARAMDLGVDATLEDHGLAGHYMLSHIGRWNGFATEQSLAILGAHHH